MGMLRFVHRWLGIMLALPLLVQGLSGAILTLEPVLPDWGPRATGETPASANAVLAGAMTVMPAGMRPSRYLQGEAAGMPVRVQFAPLGQPRGPGAVVSVDAATAVPLGPAVAVGGAMEWVKRLHTNLLVPEWGGRQIAGWLGVGLLALTVLGLPLWWPSREERAAGRWGEAFTVPRGARGARLQRRLHGAMGIWLVVMMLATSVTGIIQGFPQTARGILGNAAEGPPRPGGNRMGREGGGREGGGVPVPVPDLDSAIRLALGAAPGLQLRMAMLPPGAGEPLRLILGPPGSEGVTSATTVLLDGGGSKLRSVQSPMQASPGETVLRWAHDLHFGQGFGPIWRGLTVLVGVALPAFGVTGVWLWLLKRRNRRRLQGVREAAMGASSQAGD